MCMSIREKLSRITGLKQTVLCVGLDADAALLPEGFGHTPGDVVAFNREIINATRHVAAAYKINTAFYEQYGSRGWAALEATRTLLPDDAISIADAKRGDIGNTNNAYARTFYQTLDFDSATVSPYLGFDSIETFLQYPDKPTFALALTSNIGSADFQRLDVGGKPLYRKVIERCCEYRGAGEIGFVVGATHPSDLAEIRSYTKSVLLIPGVGTQGGAPDEVLAANGGESALVNVSRQIIYASSGADFAERARENAEKFAAQLRIIA